MDRIFPVCSMCGSEDRVTKCGNKYLCIKCAFWYDSKYDWNLYEIERYRTRKKRKRTEIHKA